jgi:ribonuclease BN (tRNA processing enzyme)
MGVNMKVRFLGTNGWFDSTTGNTICTLIETDDMYLVLDAGNGIHKLDRYIHDQKPVYLFLSHFHLDHIEGLHTIVKLRLPRGLMIFGMEGTEKFLGDVIRKPYTVPLGKGPYPVEVHEVPGDHELVPFLEDFRFLIHSDPCMGFRFSLEGKTIAYCTDTGVCDNLITLGKDADLLITECSELSGEHSRLWPHMNPEDAVYVAKRSGAKRMALTHFNAHHYDTLEARKKVQERLAEQIEDLTVAFDDMTIEI